MRLLRIAAYVWASPNTMLGLCIALVGLLTGTRLQFVQGVVEVHGGLVTWLLRRAVPLEDGASALTLGHVVLGVSPAALDITRDHERVHVRQYERWGPLFIPAYGAASIWALIRGKRPYRDNLFEREAYGETASKSHRTQE